MGLAHTNPPGDHLDCRRGGGVGGRRGGPVGHGRRLQKVAWEGRPALGSVPLLVPEVVVVVVVVLAAPPMCGRSVVVVVMVAVAVVVLLLLLLMPAVPGGVVVARGVGALRHGRLGSHLSSGGGGRLP